FEDERLWIAETGSVVRRLGHRNFRRRPLFQGHETFAERFQRLLHPLDHLPLLGDLVGELLDRLFLFGGEDFQLRQPVFAHGVIPSSAARSRSFSGIGLRLSRSTYTCTKKPSAAACDSSL